MRSVFGDFGRPRPPASRREAGALAYVIASIAYVIAMCAVAIVPLPFLLRSILPETLDVEMRTNIALGLGLALAVVLVLPFILEAADARRRPQPGLA
jgi:uncharacterized membrane protein